MASVDKGTTASYWHRADGRLVESNVAGTVTSVFYDKDGHNGLGLALAGPRGGRCCHRCKRSSALGAWRGQPWALVI